MGRFIPNILRRKNTLAFNASPLAFEGCWNSGYPIPESLSREMRERLLRGRNNKHLTFCCSIAERRQTRQRRRAKKIWSIHLYFLSTFEAVFRRYHLPCTLIFIKIVSLNEKSNLRAWKFQIQYSKETIIDNIFQELRCAGKKSLLMRILSSQNVKVRLPQPGRKELRGRREAWMI